MSAPSPLARYGMRGLALVYLAAAPGDPAGDDLLPDIRGRHRPPLDAITSSDGHPRLLDDGRSASAIAVPLNTVFGVLCALMLVRQKFRGKALINSVIDLPFAISPVVIGLVAVPDLRQRRPARRPARGRRDPDHLLDARA